MIKVAEIWHEAYPGPRGEGSGSTSGSGGQGGGSATSPTRDAGSGGGSTSGPPSTPTRPGTNPKKAIPENSGYEIDASKFHPWENPYNWQDTDEKNRKLYNERQNSVNTWLSDPKNSAKVNLRPTATYPRSFDFSPRMQTANMSYMDLYNKSKEYLRSTPLWKRDNNNDFMRRFGFTPANQVMLKSSSVNIFGLVKAANALRFTNQDASRLAGSTNFDFSGFSRPKGPSWIAATERPTPWNVRSAPQVYNWMTTGPNSNANTNSVARHAGSKLRFDIDHINSVYGTSNLDQAIQAQRQHVQQWQAEQDQFRRDHADLYKSPEYKQMKSSPEYKQKLQASQQKIDQQYAPIEQHLQHWQNIADSVKDMNEVMARQDKQVADENTTIQNMAGQMDPSKFNKANPLDTVHYMDQQIAEKRRQAGAANIDPQEKARLDAEVKSLQSAAVRARSQAQDAARKDPSLMSDFALRHGRHNVGSTVMDDSITNPYYKQVLQDQQKAFRAKEQVQNAGLASQPTAPQPAASQQRAKPTTPAPQPAATQPAAKPTTPAPQPAATQQGAKPATPARPATR